VEEDTTPNQPVVEARMSDPTTLTRPAGGPGAGAMAHPDAPYCYQCGVQMQRAGSCHACPSCGTTSGCS
jgi:ribonucleoside-diphosphate reductase alpha chain